MKLDGKTALITGGSSGIGLASARMVRDYGARIAIMGSSREKLHRAVAELGGDVLAIQGDVSSLVDLAQMQDVLKREFDRRDILFANAGIAYGTPVATTDEAAYTRIMDVNVKGVFFTVQAVLPLMREGGSIVLNTSWLQSGRHAGPWAPVGVKGCRSFLCPHFVGRVARPEDLRQRGQSRFDRDADPSRHEPERRGVSRVCREGGRRCLSAAWGDRKK